MSGREVRETLGFLGVMASLVFVGLEIRQNTRVARATDPQLAELWPLISEHYDPEFAEYFEGRYGLTR